MNKVLISLMIAMIFFVGSCGGDEVGCKIEGENRVITCSEDSTKEQKQICSQGKWIDLGVCFVCEEKDKRTIPCATDDTKEQIQICYSDNWVDEGGCICSENNRFCYSHDGLDWSDASSISMNWDEAITYCENMGGRLPTISELRTLIKNCPATETGGKCGISDSCLSWNDCWSACGGCKYDESGKYSVFGDTYCFWSSLEPSDYTDNAWSVCFRYGSVGYNRKYNLSSVRCVRSGDTGNTGDLGATCTGSDKFCHSHDGLNWSDASSSYMDWDKAVAYCENLGGRFPTISELRTLIKNCPATETGGACKVTDNCLSWDKCRDACDGCSGASDGRYSELGDTGWFWSSSEQSDRTGGAWLVYFKYGKVANGSKNYSSRLVRCLR